MAEFLDEQLKTFDIIQPTTFLRTAETHPLLLCWTLVIFAKARDHRSMHSHTSIHFWFFLAMCLGHPWMHAQGRFPEQPSEAEGPELTWRTTIEPIPSAPDYTSAAAWSVLPADVSEDGFALLPPKTHRRTSLASCPDSLKADVFFIHRRCQ